MKEKIIQGGIVNGEKMLVCPTWEDEFQKAIHKTGGCFRISMDYSAVDVSWWKELEKIAGKYGYTLDSESLEMVGDIWGAIIGVGCCYSPSFLEVAPGKGYLFCSLFIFADVYQFVPFERGE